MEKNIAPPNVEVDGSKILYATDLLEREMDLKDKNIVVIGSGMTGLETAEYLASKGNNVTVVEMLKQIGPDVYDVVLYDIITRLKKIKCKLNAF